MFTIGAMAAQFFAAKWRLMQKSMKQQKKN